MTERQQRTLMALFAHPDAEVIAPGGTIALESRRGARVVLVVATGGESDFFYFQVPHGLLGEEYFTAAASAIGGPPPSAGLFEGVTIDDA